MVAVFQNEMLYTKSKFQAFPMIAITNLVEIEKYKNLNKIYQQMLLSVNFELG